RPMRDPALADAVRCTGEAFGTTGAPREVGAPELEAWRKEAHGVGRVAFAAAGGAAIADAAATALARAGGWPEVRPAPAEALPPGVWGGSAERSGARSPNVMLDAPAEVYDVTGDAPAGTARATLAVHVARAAQAVAAAETLGDPRG